MVQVSSTASAFAEFDAFFSVSAPRVLRQLLLITGDTGEAEDVTQEAFERAWLQWAAVRDCESPEACVRTVARRLAVSRWRRVNNAPQAWLRRGIELEPAGGDDGSGHVALVAALRRLPRKQRVAVVLFHLADLSVEEVSAETGDSVSAVKQQLSRGRAALASLLVHEPQAPLTRSAVSEGGTLMTGDLVEDTGARDGLSNRMHAVAATFEVTPPSAAAVRRHAERRRTTRRVVGGGVAALVAGVLLLAPDGAVTTAPSPVAPATRPSATAATPAPIAAPVPTGWGPDVPHFAVAGQPMAGVEPWPGEATSRTMTEVSTGVVYVDPTTDQVVHRSWDEQETVIGTTPWQRRAVDGETLPAELGGAVYGDHRELVGNPGHPLVAWVESVDGARGDLVVVRASTGEVLARTPVPGDPDREVIIASVDPEAVYLATPLPDQLSGMSGRDVWTWRWSDGAPPEDARDIADVILDVGSGVWVVHGPRGVQLLDSAGQVMLATDHPGDRQFFGHMLSPDGRFWRSWGDEVTETATGELWVVPGTGPQVSRFAWGDVDEQVVFVDGRLMLCTYPSGACSEPVYFPDSDGAQLDMPTS